MSRLVSLSALTCTWKLCMCLSGNGSTVTMNNAVGRDVGVLNYCADAPLALYDSHELRIPPRSRTNNRSPGRLRSK